MSGFDTAFRRLFIVLVPVLLAPAASKAELVITGVFTGGSPPPTMVGGGSLQDSFNAAATFWERAFSAPGDNWNVTIQYGWTPLMGINGEHLLLAQGGTPNRETLGQIYLDNSGNTLFFADPTPFDNSEFQSYTTYASDLGAGTLNTGRVFTAVSGPAAGKVDLFTIVAHEIGHGLGIFFENLAYQQQVPGNTLEILPPLPFAGSTLFMFSGHIDMSQLPHALMSNVQPPSERILISAADVLAEAQISQFLSPTLDPYAAPEPSSLMLLRFGGVGLLGVAEIRRRLRT